MSEVCAFPWGGGTWGPAHICALPGGHGGDHISDDGCTDDGLTPWYDHEDETR